MRLSKIKLSGFKSFVDTTTIPLPSNLVGVVGPNGCGKSNVIDAIRWVMGETSAKHLRGDSMADVIFNGSAGRKPVGTATIELFFDNSDGAIGGQYAGYSEISIKRSVSRDGTSQYFLNGTRCRRKDITGIFLGTGLGPRSYAIIEQGMVSRLIEAKPDDMRVYIEEAAGISKYKERRRETETRIRHTRDNLDRLNDLREEVDKQIKHLQRQARQAERYQELKQDERRLERELLAIRMSTMGDELRASQSQLAQAQNQMEAAVAEQRSIEASIEKARLTHTESTEAFNEIQGRYYAVQSEISRLEQSITHSRDTRSRQEADLAEAEAQRGDLAGEIDKDTAQLADLEEQLARLAPDLEQAKAVEETSSANLQRVEDALEAWQTTWHEFNLETKEYQRTAEVEQTRIEQLEMQVARLCDRREELATEGSGISLDEFESMLTAASRAEQDSQATAASCTKALEVVDTRIAKLREAERDLGERLQTAHEELASRRARVETLEAVQAAALGEDEEVAQRWLKGNGLAEHPRLAQRLQVEPEWSRAVETVLGGFLQAVCVPRPDEHLQRLPGTDLTLLDQHDETGGAAQSGTLASVVQQAGQAARILEQVKTAPDLKAALALRSRLRAEESVVTPDGLWLGNGWVRVHRGQREAAGLISREQDIRELRDQIRDGEHDAKRLGEERSAARTELASLEGDRSTAAERVTSANRVLAEAAARLSSHRQDFDRARERLQSLSRDEEGVKADLTSLEAGIRDARARLNQATEATARAEDRRPVLKRQQQELVDEYNRVRDEAETQRENAARIAIEYESRRASKESASTTLGRIQTQRADLEARMTNLRDALSASVTPLADLQSNLETQLAAEVEVDRLMNERRRELEEADLALRNDEGRRANSEKQVEAARVAADELRMAVREVEVRRESLAEQFKASGSSDPEELIASLDETATVETWTEQLGSVQRKIERLGAINLAAIDEFSEQSERKEYLDAQFEDLTAALETLEQAIRKIDRETRARFKETFDKVNAGLQRLFPKLFGGGRAYLSLDGEDLLSTGVTVMAQPPGKRNSHIHLLSGGEKALTAVALIFSIFELNPAPFCLLDEVDAPLDEANVGRFCDIVKEMSSTVQFIVITHNKTTMEMVRQLTGVTMNEPGVSRLVSVDIDEAVQLVAS